MKKVVTLKSVEIENFKGISSLRLSFGERQTDIVGANGTGKSSIVDAYLWAMTGKDSSGSESFKVQPVDENNVTKPHLITRVELKFSIDGEERLFTKTLSQKWTKPRGTNEEVLNGNTNVYEVDGVPMSLTEYNKKITELLCDTDTFKMVSSVTQFLSLKVQDKRKLLMSMAGDVEDVLTKESFPHLYDEFVTARSVEGVKTKAQYALKELNLQNTLLPGKVSENERNMPTNIDFDALRAEKDRIEDEIRSIDSVLEKNADMSLFNEKSSLMASLDNVRLEMDKIIKYYADESDNALKESQLNIKKMYGEISSLEVERGSKNRSLAIAKSDVALYMSDIDKLGKMWTEENERTFDDVVEDVCPYCKRPFTSEELAEMKNSMVKAFNSGKAAKLELIVKDGNTKRKCLDEANALVESLKSDIVVIDAKVSELRRKISEMESNAKDTEDVQSKVEKDEKFKELVAKAERLTDSLKELELSSMNSDEEVLKERKASLKDELNKVVASLAEEKMVAKVEQRRKELHDEGVSIASAIALQEQILFEIKKYQKARINAVEEKVSSMFSLVRWQMYEQNLTNDGEKEICECLVDGVPYSSNLNSAAKVNAGVDIVNAISRWKGISLPLFIDNKETVTRLIDSEAQIITLSVGDFNNITVANVL